MGHWNLDLYIRKWHTLTMKGHSFYYIKIEDFNKH